MEKLNLRMSSIQQSAASALHGVDKYLWEDDATNPVTLEIIRV